MGKREKEPMSVKDKATYFTSIIGGFFILVTVIPFIPWSAVPMDSNFGPMFASNRRFSLLSATDKDLNLVTWFTWRRGMCATMQQYNTPNPVQMVTSVVTMGIQSATGKSVAAAAGCQNWQPCKEHVKARCNGYTTLAVVGLISTVFLAVSAILGFVVPVMMGMEAGTKKKKKHLEAAKFNTMIVCIVAFVLTLISLVAWSSTQGSTVKDFQRTGYYPTPKPHAAFYLAVVGLLLQLIGMICGILRTRTEKKEEDEDDEPPADPNMAPLLPGMAPPPAPGM